MANKLFVGGISWNTDEGLLKSAFEVHGAVTEARIITDRETGRSRGFGFVTFEDASCAEAAVEALNGTEIDGRTITVNVAKEREDRGGRGGGGGRGGYGGGGGGGRGGYGGGGGGGRGGRGGGGGYGGGGNRY